MLDKEIKLDFPVFAVHGNEILDKEIANIVELSTIIENLNNEIENLENEIQNSGNKLNIYINNTIENKEPFDYTKHLVIFNDNEELCIYPYELIDEFSKNEMENEIEEDLIDEMEFIENLMENFLNNLPKTNDKYQLKEKQKLRTLELIEEYNFLYEEYQFLLLDIEDYDKEYSTILNEIKENLSQIKLMDVKKEDLIDNKNFKIEPFNNTKHELLITKDSNTSKWKFVYVRKKDSKKLFSLMDNLSLKE